MAKKSIWIFLEAIYTPDFVFLEIEKYEDRIIKKTKLQDTFKDFAREIFSEIIVIPKLAISKNSFIQALHFCEDIDEKDTPFLALSIELNIPLWTNDKPLLDGLQAKGYKNLISSDAIFSLLSD